MTKRRFPKEVSWADFAASMTGDSGRRLAKLWTSKGKRATHKRERREAKRNPDLHPPIYHEGDYYS